MNLQSNKPFFVSVIIVWLLPILFGAFINYELIDVENEFVTLLWYPFVFSIYFFTRKKIAFYIPYALISIMGLVQIVHWLSIEGPLSTATLFIGFETNAEEAFGFIDTYLSEMDQILIGIYVLIVMYLGKGVDNIQRNTGNSRIMIVLIVALPLFILHRIHINRLHLGFPNLFVSIYEYYEEMEHYKNQYDQSLGLKDFKVQHDVDVPETYILIIGESLNRNHMSLYGYSRNTTPLLNELCKGRETLAFSDAISSQTTTRASLQQVLSFANKDNGLKYYETINFMDVMNKAGFQTYWISNQPPIGLWDNSISIMAQTADSTLFLNMSGNSTKAVKSRSYDEKVLKPFEEIMKLNDEKKLIVVHLMGSHMAYRFRYPSEYDQFEDLINDNEDYSETINQYDNSVLYNDYVVSELINISHQYEGEGLMNVCYFADHGEEVYDSQDDIGHGLAKKTRHLVEIPLIFSFSETYLNRFPKISENLKAVSNRPYMIDDLLHTLCGMYQIQLENYDDTRNVWSNTYEVNRKRITSNEYDYDQGMKKVDAY